MLLFLCPPFLKVILEVPSSCTAAVWGNTVIWLISGNKWVTAELQHIEVKILFLRYSLFADLCMIYPCLTAISIFSACLDVCLNISPFVCFSVPVSSLICLLFWPPPSWSDLRSKQTHTLTHTVSHGGSPLRLAPLQSFWVVQVCVTMSMCVCVCVEWTPDRFCCRQQFYSPLITSRSWTSQKHLCPPFSCLSPVCPIFTFSPLSLLFASSSTTVHTRMQKEIYFNFV